MHCRARGLKRGAKASARRWRLALASLAALAVPLPVTAHAAEAPRVSEYVDLFTSGIPGTATGRQLRLDHVNPRDPEGKPQAPVHERVELHPGSRFDTSAVPRCSASDLELTVRGPAACPRSSFVGSGEIHLDTGLPGPLRLSVNDVTVINAARQIVFVLESRGTPAPIRLIVRGNVAGNTIDIPLPSIPGMDGPAPTFEVLTFWRRSTVVDRRPVSYLTTPPTCPVSGRWTNRFTFTYWDGVVQTFTTTSPCEWRAAHARRPLRVEGRDEDGAEQQATRTTTRGSSR